MIDFKITEDNLIYASYSRGYKSGGINPPLQPVFAVPESFKPEQVDAFEIGSKNSFGNGALQLNATAFYYKYKDLQLSKIVARTAVNDNVSADIYGFEIEGMVRPDPNWLINLGFSYLHTKVTEDKLTSNPRDFGGGRADAVIIKDITNGANCAVSSTSGNVTGVNAFVNTVNNVINAGLVPASPPALACRERRPSRQTEASLRPVLSAFAACLAPLPAAPSRGPVSTRRRSAGSNIIRPASM